MYDDIQIPIPDQPISASQFGIRVRDSIIDLNTRVSRIESTLSNYGFKASTTTRANTVTPTIDPDLQMFLEANSTYFVEFFVTCAAILAEDIRTSWTVPSGTTSIDRRILGPGSAANQTDADNISVRMATHAYATNIIYSGVRNSLALQFQFQEVAIVKTGANSGTCGLNWAQGTTGATGTTVNSDSFCRATKVV